MSEPLPIAFVRSLRRHEVRRRCLRIALIVGTLLSLVNQGDLIALGLFDVTLGWRLALNYLIPFTVSNLGAMSSLPPPRDPLA